MQNARPCPPTRFVRKCSRAGSKLPAAAHPRGEPCRCPCGKARTPSRSAAAGPSPPSGRGRNGPLRSGGRTGGATHTRGRGNARSGGMSSLRSDRCGWTRSAGDDVLRVLFQDDLWNRKPTTASRLRQQIRIVLSWAQAREFVERDVAGEAIDGALPKRRRRAKSHRALPHAEVRELLARVAVTGGGPPPPPVPELKRERRMLGRALKATREHLRNPFPRDAS